MEYNIALYFCTSVHGYAVRNSQFIWEPFYINLEAPRNRLMTQAKNAQYNLVWVDLHCSWNVHWHICWRKWLITTNVKNYHLTLARRHICYNFLPFHDCLLRFLVIMKLSNMLDTELGYHLLRNDSRGLKSDETQQLATAWHLPCLL